MQKTTAVSTASLNTSGKRSKKKNCRRVREDYQDKSFDSSLLIGISSMSLNPSCQKLKKKRNCRRVRKDYQDKPSDLSLAMTINSDYMTAQAHEYDALLTSNTIRKPVPKNFAASANTTVKTSRSVHIHD